MIRALSLIGLAELRMVKSSTTEVVVIRLCDIGKRHLHHYPELCLLDKSQTIYSKSEMIVWKLVFI